MNERLVELYKQATAQAHETVGGEHANTSYFQGIVNGMFADLIVRECNQAVLEVPCYYKDYRSQIEEVVINDCARAVLEHFGVEP